MVFVICSDLTLVFILLRMNHMESDFWFEGDSGKMLLGLFIIDFHYPPLPLLLTRHKSTFSAVCAEQNGTEKYHYGGHTHTHTHTHTHAHAHTHTHIQTYTYMHTK